MLSAVIFSVTMVSVIYDVCSMFDSILSVIIPSVITANVAALDAETKLGVNFINILRA
jgi:hypothetical protein